VSTRTTGRRQDGDAIPYFDALNVLADVNNVARDFVAERDGGIKTISSVANVQVCATQATPLNGNFYVCWMFKARFRYVA
jgi:hypothetical protein